jgi:hypothetical protein
MVIPQFWAAIKPIGRFGGLMKTVGNTAKKGAHYTGRPVFGNMTNWISCSL